MKMKFGKRGQWKEKGRERALSLPSFFPFYFRAHDYLGAWNRVDTGLLASSHTLDIREF